MRSTPKIIFRGTRCVDVAPRAHSPVARRSALRTFGLLLIRASPLGLQFAHRSPRVLRDAGEAEEAAGVKDLVRSDVEKLSLAPGGGRARPLAELQRGEVWIEGCSRLGGDLQSAADTMARLSDDVARRACSSTWQWECTGGYSGPSLGLERAGAASRQPC